MSEAGVGRTAHQVGRADLGGEAPAGVEREQLGLADQLEAADVGERRVGDDGVEQRGADAGAAMALGDDDVEEQGNVRVVGEDSREAGQPASRPVDSWVMAKTRSEWSSR